jgi:chromate transporter
MHFCFDEYCQIIIALSAFDHGADIYLSLQAKFKNMNLLIQLALSFGLLSILAVGGGTAVLPEMQTLLAHQFDIGHTQFVHIYSIGQVAPGPNMLMVLIIGFQVAGLLGALVVLLAFFIPSSVLCFYAGRLWSYFGENPWRRSIQNALEPISVGLMASGVYAVGKASIVSPLTAGLALITLYLILRTKINPVIVILGSGLVATLITQFL